MTMLQNNWALETVTRKGAVVVEQTPTTITTTTMAKEEAVLLGGVSSLVRVWWLSLRMPPSFSSG